MPDLASAFPLLAVAALYGYLMGSVPYGLLITKAAGLGDVRNIGSGNIGATNVLRTGRKGLAAATLLADALKGTIAVLVAGRFGQDAALAAGAAALIGHCFPVWLGFKGGKGVATYLGVLAGLYPPGLLVFAVVWLAVAFFSRYSSAAALSAMVLVPPAIWFGPGIALSAEKRTAFEGDHRVAVVMAAMSLLVIAKHHTNIRRLLTGTETRIGSKG
ncbi:glycerol-3-phosphate 1-O-acyltransferase PlsY [Prosthecodimorpha staleyi]|uniref:Glycerol-3-phosphate acyltransferase n=1 Tax=Prosthecodimorpha staleyi TaxID=2840188 RepID=A0A947D6Y1_9HYPH|nr:glycerol-3-phosphate 1-O-acyltransferase PlsY [Prosthecodimorpha staleyi]MBT9292215.1 glycerol-3-phosphate 1-O-acyltransferase PlsY [Prosthecodimorpha staleyi]